jgi:ribonuclease HI
VSAVSRVEVTGLIKPPDPRFGSSPEVIVATDAAVNFDRHWAGSGFVTSSGLWGAAGHPQPPAVAGNAPIVVAELRAVWRAVDALVNSRFVRANITVLTDSGEALGYLLQWRAGHEVYPAGYQLRRLSGTRPSLERLAEQLRHDGDRYTLSKVRGHAGHHLNEAADSLARLALRCGTRNGVTRADAHKAASVIVAARLADYWKENTKEAAP